MSGFTSSSGNTRLLQAILNQLKRDADRANDTQERVQQQLATVNEGENLAVGERRYGDS